MLRLAASFVLAARDNGLSDEDARRLAIDATASYQQIISAAAAQRSNLDNWYTMLTPDNILDAIRGGLTQKQAKKATRTSARPSPGRGRGTAGPPSAN